MNTFGSSTQQFPLYDPRGARAERLRFRRSSIPELECANSLYVPGGRWPTRGWLLLSRFDYNRLNKYSTTLQLNIGDPRRQDNVATIKNLSIVQAQCVTRGIAADQDALYLVEVTDGRGILCNEWFKFPLTTQYNIRTPAYPQTFHPQSMNSGTTWTWSTMLQDMWTRMGTFLGAWPGLPTTPSGTPEGHWYTGVCAWTALNNVLDHIGLTIAVDPTTAAPYTIVQPGATDNSFTALSARYNTVTSPNYRLEDDLEFIDTGAGRVPGTIKVFFKKRYGVYGNEETVRYDSPQWDMSAYYEISVSAPSDFSGAVGTHHIWDDYTIRWDQEGNPLGADVAIAQQIAQERVTQYFARIYNQTLGNMYRTYAGALPFVTGSQVDGVCWYQDFKHCDRQGWMTRIVRGDEPPFECCQ